MKTSSRLIAVVVMLLVVSCANAQAPAVTPPPIPTDAVGVVGATTAPPAATPVVKTQAEIIAESKAATATAEAEKWRAQAEKAQAALANAGKQMATAVSTLPPATPEARIVQNITNEVQQPKDCKPIWDCLSYWVGQLYRDIAKAVKKLTDRMDGQDKKIADLRTDVDTLKKVQPTPPPAGTAPAPGTPPPAATLTPPAEVPGVQPVPTPAVPGTPAPQVPGTAVTPTAPTAPAIPQTPAAMVDQQARDAAKVALDTAKAAQGTADTAKSTADGAKTTADAATKAATEATTAATAASDAATTAANSAADANKSVTALSATVQQVSNAQQADRSWLRYHGMWLWIIGLLLLGVIAAGYYFRTRFLNPTAGS